MPRELEGKREYLEQLWALDPKEGVLSVEETARFCGMSVRNVYREFPTKNGTVSKYNIADWMAEEHKKGKKRPRR